MSLQIIQGYCTDSDYQVHHDEEGYAYRIFSCVIGSVTVKIRTNDNADFYPSGGDYLVLEYDPQTKKATRAYKPFPSRGVGSGWKKLKKEVADEHYFYKYLTGEVKHKEIKHHNDDLSRDGYSGGISYKIVLTNGEYFIVNDRDGKHVSTGDEVENLATDEYGHSIFRNITTGYYTSPSIAIRILLYGLSIGFISVIIALLISVKEWDGGKIAFLFILAGVPVLFLASRFRELKNTPKQLKLMERLRKSKLSLAKS